METRYGAARKVVCQSTVHKQSGGTCYAHAIAGAIVANQLRCFGWKAITHDELVSSMVQQFGKDGAHTSKVLQWLCPEHPPIKWRDTTKAGALAAWTRDERSSHRFL